MMKTIKKMVLLVIMLNIATGYANEKNIDAPNQTITFLKFLNVKKGHQYRIKDSQGVVLYSETIKRNGSFSKKFDFNNLNDGLYIFEIVKDFEIITKPFKIESKSVSFLNDKVTKAFKPFVRLKKNTLLISQLTLDETPLKVELFYKGELILSDELKGNQILERAYRLSKDVRGDYFLKLKFGDRYFSEAFEL